MKLILLTTLILKYAGNIRANEQYGFRQQFQKPNTGVFASDSSVYLPPESHTPIPFFSIKNMNNLPFPYLPPTGTKAPSVYPSPFPVILSSTMVPIFDDDEKDEREEINNIRISSPQPPKPQIKNNITEKVPHGPPAMRREMRLPPKMPNYHNPIDRIDMRLPTRDFPMGPTTSSPIHQSPRNMIISVDTHRNDLGLDHIRSPSVQSSHYIPSPGFSISSTTEPAIPILRLSNEMDLDGSFSYEALGADQTHYVQHSHMENMGTEKEEQVVEGSYSYVGDNGQTYTVHYIADSNGFRASGDHLPVAPPIPEIIQRAVQYNLAEEAKKPPHLRSWQTDEKEYDNIDKHQHYVPPIQPPRSLFTGRTPEAFSYNFGQGSNNENNLVAAPSSQVPVKTNSDFTIDQSRGKSNGPITPQVTFLASQGAHVPSMNNAPQQSISRVSTMPQLINYDAGIKEAEQEANKGLWRWQYGLNSNTANQTPEKNTISRSSGEGDDIMINFSDMTSDQYTKMLESQLEPRNKDHNAATKYVNDQQQQNFYFTTKSNANENVNNEYQNNILNQYYSHQNNTQPILSTQGSATTTLSYVTSIPDELPKESKILSQTTTNDIHINDFNRQVQHLSQSYDYFDNNYEPRRIKALHVHTTTKPSINNGNTIPAFGNEQKNSYNNIWSNAKDLHNHLQNELKITQVPPLFNTLSAPKHLEDINFQPILNYKEPEERLTTTTTSTTTTLKPETSTEDLFQTNIFLKSVGFVKKSEQHKSSNQIAEEPKKVSHNKIAAETKSDKIPKIIPYQPKPHNDVKSLKRKPMDLSDIMNYINMKNYFESNKMKPKTSLSFNNYDKKNEMRHIPVSYDEIENEEEDFNVPKNSLRSLNNQEHDELRGIIKNYKVLQRNNHARHSDLNSYQNRREITPPPVKMHQSAGLPPLGRAGPSMKTYLPPTYV